MKKKLDDLFGWLALITFVAALLLCLPILIALLKKVFG